MYLPSFFTGSLIGRFGTTPLMAAGLSLNAVAALCLLSDTASFWSYFVCLTTIGVGWNWGYVSATAALVESTSAYTREEQSQVKGFNDLCIQLLGAVGTLLTGFAVSAWGWAALVWICAALLLVQLGVIGTHERARKRGQADDERK